MGIKKAQNDLLNELLGDEGSCFQTITDSKLINLGTKLLYLERATTLKPVDFKIYLDKLYQTKSHLDLIRDLVRLNDLVFNQPIKVYKHKMCPALEATFEQLGPVDVKAFQLAIRTYITAYQIKLTHDQAKQADIEKVEREQLEAFIEPRTGWQEALDTLSEEFETDSAPELTEEQMAIKARLVDEGQASVNYLDSLSIDILCAILDGSLSHDNPILDTRIIDMDDNREDSPISERPAPRYARYSFFDRAARAVGLQWGTPQRTRYGF
ncbi:MAG: hypothetical protein QNK11_08395 [Legionella sp.]|nr:hypothetical protein [Legionella sp.]